MLLISTVAGVSPVAGKLMYQPFLVARSTLLLVPVRILPWVTESVVSVRVCCTALLVKVLP